MKASSFVSATALLSVANIQVAHAGFFGTFNPVPEPSSLALLAAGGAVAAAVYLTNRKGKK